MTAAHLIPDLQPIGWLGVISTLCVIAAYAFKAIRSVVRFMNLGFEFFADWKGEKARPGFVARPGIPERIARLEAQSLLTQSQLLTNGGMSLRDQTNRIEATLEQHIKDSSEGHG